MKRVRITGIGSYLPEKILTNLDLEKIVDTSDEWIRTRTGIVERHIAADNEATSDMVAKAAINALEMAEKSIEDIDAIIVATDTPDNAYPSTACWVQKHLNTKGQAAFDMEAGCSGWLYGLVISKGLIESKNVRRILLCGGETMSRAVNWEDRSTCVLFGDGAGCAVLEESEDDSGILSTYWGADGNLGDLLVQPAGGSRMPASKETVEKKLHTVFMAGNEVFKSAVRSMQMAAVEALKKAGIEGKDVDIFIPHQANLRIIEATRERAGIPKENTFITIDHTANVSAATIPIALDEAVRNGKVKKGDIVLFDAFGGGFTWGAAVLKW